MLSNLVRDRPTQTGPLHTQGIPCVSSALPPLSPLPGRCSPSASEPGRDRPASATSSPTTRGTPSFIGDSSPATNPRHHERRPCHGLQGPDCCPATRWVRRQRPAAPLGRGYYVLVHGDGSDGSDLLQHAVDARPEALRLGRLQGSTGHRKRVLRDEGRCDGVIDAAKGEVRISVPVADLSAVTKIKKGDKLKDVIASTTAVHRDVRERRTRRHGRRSSSCVGVRRGLAVVHRSPASSSVK